MTQETVQLLLEQFVAFAPKLILSILMFIGFWFAGVIFRAVIDRLGKRSRVQEEVLDLVKRLVRVGFVIFGAVTALGTLGVDVSALVAGLGLTGFALGFAFQDIIANVLSGVLILTYRPFRRGNTIVVGAHTGVVVDVDLRYTWLKSEGKTVLIPNASLFKEAITVLTPAAPVAQQTPLPPSMMK
jgi:small-conductance mechanosensitive channel